MSLSKDKVMAVISAELAMVTKKQEIVSRVRKHVLYRVRYHNFNWSSTRRGEHALYGELKAFNTESLRFSMLAATDAPFQNDTERTISFRDMISVEEVSDRSELLLCVGWEYKSDGLVAAIKSGLLA